MTWSVSDAAVGAAAEHGPSLSDQQERIWYLSRLDPEGPGLNVGLALHLDGPLDLDRLDGAVRLVARRHPRLTAVFGVDDRGEPRLRSTGEGAGLIVLDELDIDAPACGSVTDDALQVVLRRRFDQSFDLAGEPPLRTAVVPLGPTGHVLIVVGHRIAIDPQLWPAYLDEVAVAYRAQDPEPAVAAETGPGSSSGTVSPSPSPSTNGQAAPAPAPISPPPSAVANGHAAPAPISPPPSAVANGHAAPAVVSRLRPVEAEVPPLEFPGESRSRRLPGSAAAMLTIELGADRLATLRDVAGEAGVGPSEVFVALFQLVLARTCSAPDHLLELASAPGADARRELLDAPVDRSVVIRSLIDEDRPLSELLRLVKAETSRARVTGPGGTNGAPAADDELLPDRRALTRVRFAEHTSPAAAFDLPGVSATVLAAGTGHALVPLTLTVESEPSGGVTLRLEYQIDVVSDVVATAVEWQVRGAVEALSPELLDEPLSRLPSVAPSRRDLLLDFARGARSPDGPATLPELVSAAAAERPNEVAVVAPDGVLRFGPLLDDADRLAAVLADQGVRAGDVVATLLAPSAELVVTAVAIVRLGAVYLPLDPDLPSGEIDRLLAETRPVGLIGPGAAGRADVTRLSTKRSTATPNPAHPVVPRHPVPSPEDPAFIVGCGVGDELRGVVVSHQAISGYLRWIVRLGDLGPADSVLQVAPPGFDASVGEIFGCLISGARLVIPRSGGLADVGYLGSLLDEQHITSLHMVPSLLGAFLALPGVERWTTLRRVPVGGEPLSGDLADRFNATFDAELHNFYGSAEVTLAACHQQVGFGQGPGVVPIGRPKADADVHVLDERLRLVEVGVVGEIYVGGSQLASGYHRRTGDTAARFVADPFTDGGRLFRTGDLGRWSADGTLDYVRRADRELRVRGHRLDAAEVEAAVASAAGSTQCVVDVSGGDAEARLLAYVVLPGGATLAPEVEQRIRQTVSSRLPAHLVPERVVAIAALPLTTTGKLDRSRLRAPAEPFSEPIREAATESEARLCTIFGDVVGRPSVGANESFFDLGGTALLAARLAGRIGAAFGVELSIPVVFERPTPAALAEYLDLHVIDLGSTSEAPAVDNRPGPVDPPIPSSADPSGAPSPLSATQTQLLDRLASGGVADADQVVFGFEVDGPIDADVLQAALVDVVARHELLHTAFPSVGGAVEPRSVDEPDLRVVYDTTGAGADSLLWRSWREAPPEPDLRPVATDLIVRSPQCSVLVLRIHALSADHWSLPTLMADLAVAYRARRRRLLPDWPPRYLQYADVVAWQRVKGGPPTDPAVSTASASADPRPATDLQVLAAVGLVPALDRLAGMARTDRRAAAAAVVGAAVLEGRDTDRIEVWVPVPEAVPVGMDGVVGPLVHELPVTVSGAALADDPVAAVAAVAADLDGRIPALDLPVPTPHGRLVVNADLPEVLPVRLADDAGSPATTMRALAPLRPVLSADLAIDLVSAADGPAVRVTQGAGHAEVVAARPLVDRLSAVATGLVTPRRPGSDPAQPSPSPSSSAAPDPIRR
ncbi:MAG: AMP-binding protein [Actinomycetota bacterium]